MRLKGACLKTHNIIPLVDFYTKIFEQEPEIDGGVDYRFYDFQLVLFRLTNKNAPSTKDVALIYAVDDADVTYERLKSQGISLGDPPTNKPWGVRSFMIHDPDGNTVSFVAPL